MRELLGSWERTTVGSITLHHEAREREAARLILPAIERSVGVIDELWGLRAPAGCHVYVMTSWQGFVLRALPWPHLLLAGLTAPLLWRRIGRLWEHAGGWEQRLGSRHVVGIKPPRLMRRSAGGPGRRIFEREVDDRERMLHVTGHELTHAFSARLQLPGWLKEGLAMVTVDALLGRRTVRIETLEALGGGGGGDERLDLDDEDALVRLYGRAYWRTRYLEQAHPGLIRGMLARAMTPAAIEREVARACGLEHQELWRDLDAVISADLRVDPPPTRPERRRVV